MCTYTVIENGVLYNTFMYCFHCFYHLHIYLIIPVINKILDEEEDFQSTMVCEGIPSTASSKNQIENYS